MHHVGTCTDVGPDRFRLLGSYGHPGLMDLILDGVRDSDSATAAAAGAAFTKMTGLEVESDRYVAVAPAGGAAPDAFDAEFQEEVALPDPSKATQGWNAVKLRLERSQRVCRGFDLSGGLGPDAFESLDLASRWELMMRSRFLGLWEGTPLSLEVFPQAA